MKEASPVDRQARFEEMYREYEQRLLGYALRRAPVEQAKDAVAEAFLAAWRRLDDVPAEPLPWLIGATRKTLANHRRASARQLGVAQRLGAEPAAPSSEAQPADDAGAIRAALTALAPNDREALTLIAWEELTPSAAARALHCSPVAFRVRLHRARRRFAAALAAQERDTPPDARVDARTLEEMS
jgi:RNA polymerase sigma-70 factor (ECF subfamily)